MPEKGTQTPSPSPDLYPAKNLIGISHFDWYNKRGHFNRAFTRAADICCTRGS
jgi:hypothetical protein